MHPADPISPRVEAAAPLRAFRGATFVIKYGGSAMDNPALVEGVLRDVVFLQQEGVKPVVVHGGGKAITRAMKEAGFAAEFVDGLRVSDAASIELIDRTLAAEISPGIAAEIVRQGGRAQVVPGKSVLRARKMAHRRAATGEPVDLGFVGEVTAVAAAPLRALLDRDVIPVVSPLALGDGGAVYNINADLAAAEVAKALGARKLIYLTDVNGVLRDPADPGSNIPSLNPAAVAALKREGVLTGGMLPKVDSALDALDHGVDYVLFLDGKAPQALRLEYFMGSHSGTVFNK